MRNRSLISSLDRGLSRLEGKVVAILTHAGGDPDSIGSSYVLMNILKQIYQARKTMFRIPSRPSAHSKALLNYLGLSPAEDVSEANFFIVVDVGSPEQLDDHSWVLDEPEKVLVIDHHSTSMESFGSRFEIYCSEDYQSVAEMIYDLAYFIDYDLSLREAEALFAGIYYDTVRISVADEETMKKICELIRFGITPKNILSRLEFEMELSERIARLKAAMRLKLYRVKDWLIALTTVGSFRSSAARSLLSLGAHLSLIAGESDDGVEISMRASSEFVEETGINLGRDVASIVGERFKGHGGGHATAARAYCMEKDVDKILSECLGLICEKLEASAELIKP